MIQTAEKKHAKLVLADGSRFDGQFTSTGKLPVWGEVVFNTSMTGYQEVITDPSYAGQIVVMTYPEIGNYGVHHDDNERARLAARALVVRRLSTFYGPGPGRRSLLDFMQENDLPGLTGVDTRAITLRIRNQGAVIGVIGAAEQPDDELVRMAREKEFSHGEALVRSVSVAETVALDSAPASGAASVMDRFDIGGKETRTTADNAPASAPTPGAGERGETDRPGDGLRATVIDFGTKRSIVEHVRALGVATTVRGVDFTAQSVLDDKPDFVVLSNGPGDPTDVPHAVEAVKQLIGRVPILGICLGHQIAALALGARTYKLKFGHRGANQPVIDRRRNRVFMTSQNHGYAVSDDIASLGSVDITYVNASDNTLEGFCDNDRRLECVQFHPEASPGPHDSAFIFENFVSRVKEWRQVLPAATRKPNVEERQHG